MQGYNNLKLSSKRRARSNALSDFASVASPTAVPQPNFHTVVILSVAAKLPLAAAAPAAVAPWPCCALAFEVSLVELRLRFLLDIDFFLLSRVMLDGAMTSPRSSKRLSTDPPRFLKQTKLFKKTVLGVSKKEAPKIGPFLGSEIFFSWEEIRWGKLYYACLYFFKLIWCVLCVQ